MKLNPVCRIYRKLAENLNGTVTQFHTFLTSKYAGHLK